MSQDHPFISVIVPHYEDLSHLDACLTALSAQTLPRDRFEIVVGDNASPSGEEAVARTIAGRARLTIVPKKGAGPARNGGVATARGEILAFTDSDCTPDPRWLETGIAALAGHDIVGGKMKVGVCDDRHMTAPEAFEVLFAFNNEGYIRNRGFTVTANLFCSRKVFDAVGPFRTGVSEDIDWCHRALAAGYTLGYAGDAIVWHPARRTWPELQKKWKRINSELYLLHLAEGGGAFHFLGIVASQIPSAIKDTPKVIGTRFAATWSDRLAILSIMYRLRLERCRTFIGLYFSKSAA